MVFYLKYRPRKIAELDSKLLRERLQSALSGKLPDNIPHAFLFTGPKGLGKTSTARIIAKSINCTNRKKNEIEPCNVCASCKSINNGSSLDVLEIDGASNRGIDEIRDLREKIRLAPLNSKKKIYIIDEVHMLTAEAFNALLKTLEEPPAHAIFILCTTEGQKVPLTITSRCFHIKFINASNEDLINSFQRIAKGEKIKAEKEALLQIAELSDKSFRDGAKILEELSYSKNITLNLVEKKYKTKSINKYILDLVGSFEKRNAKKGIEIVSALTQEGTDFKLFTEKLINYLHQNLISTVNGSESGLTLLETKKLIELLAGSYMSIKYAILPQLPLELTIVEWSSSEDGRQRTEDGSRKMEDRGQKAEGDDQNLGRLGGLGSGGKHDKILEELIDKVKKENFSIAGVLRGCKVEKFDGKELTLSTGFKFHRERLNDKKVLTLIERLIMEITGNKARVVIV